MAKAAKSDADAEKQRKLEEYNKVVEAAELRGVQLVKLSFEVEAEYYGKREEARLGYVVTPDTSVYDADEGFAACIVDFDVDATVDNEELLHCEAKYTVIYRLSDRCEEDAVKAFLKRVGIFACYPYFRGVFANLDWAANTRLPPLPIHKEAPKPKPRVRKRNAKAIATSNE